MAAPIVEYTAIRARHEHLWLPDGNIVLSAEHRATKNRYTIFRVHKSVLARHSDVFRDMLSFSGEGTNEDYDGMPVVHMLDTAEELEELLYVLYDPAVLPFEKHDPKTPLLVQNILGMADKYQFDALRKRLVSYVEADWPTSLEEWDLAEAHIEAIKRTAPYEILDEITPEPAAAIVLARRFDIDSILPAAFYTLSRIRAQDDWDRHRREYEPRAEKGEKDAVDDEDDDWYMEDDTRTARWSLLTADNLRHLCRGRDRLDSRINEMYFTHSSTNHCKAGCKKGWKTVTRCIQRDAYETRDILAALKKYCKGDILAEKGLCVSCQSAFENKIDAEREDIWDDLPRYFKISRVS